MRTVRIFLLPALLLALAGGAVAQADTQPETQAQGSDPGSSEDAAPGTQAVRSEEEVSAISLDMFAEYMSPYCPGATLRDCGSGQARVLRDRIRDWVREGREKEWIEAQLISEFGESILGAPRFKGFGTLAYIAPVLAVLIGLGIILAFVQRQKDSPPKLTGDSALELLGDEAPGEEYRDRVRAELDVRQRR